MVLPPPPPPSSSFPPQPSSRLLGIAPPLTSRSPHLAYSRGVFSISGIPSYSPSSLTHYSPSLPSFIRFNPTVSLPLSHILTPLHPPQLTRCKPLIICPLTYLISPHSHPLPSRKLYKSLIKPFLTRYSHFALSHTLLSHRLQSPSLTRCSPPSL